MGHIKSAREIAMAKLAEVGEVTEEERLQWQYAPEGEKLAARYIRGEANLQEALGRFGEKARPYVSRGMQEILVRNLDLPRNDHIRKTNGAATAGLKLLKRDQAGLENVFSRIRRLFDHYTGQGEQQRRQAYQALKSEFTARVQQALKEQLGTATGLNININVEGQPQFKEEWQRVNAQMENQYLKLLEEYKQELLKLS